MRAASDSIWVLLGSHYGDNCQMKVLAEAISDTGNSDVIFKPLTFTKFCALPNALPNGSLLSLSTKSRALLTPPWPRMVITSGRKAVPAALWIRAHATGRVRLVHVGRPWTPLSRFDLVVTTAQYELPPRNNVQRNLMTLACPDGPHTKQSLPTALPLPEALNALPRPWLALAIGGSSAPYKLNTHCARRLATRANAFIRETGGSALLLAGPRSPEKVIPTLRAMISGPQMYFPWGPGLPHFADIAPVSDNILITGDSAALLSDAAVTGKPVEVCPLSWDPPIRYALVQHLRPHIPESFFSALISAGMITSVRNMPAFSEALNRAGMLHGGPLAATWRAQELETSARRCAALLMPECIPAPSEQPEPLALDTRHA